VSLRANVLANYASQVFVILAGVLMMPFYLRRMGAETYGLIGFFTLMNTWFQILDAGLSLTLARESARFRAGRIDGATLHALLRMLQIFFVAVAGLGALAIAASAHAIAASWLRVEHLPLATVTKAVLLMGLTVPLQWMTGLYRGAINGFERQVWLSGFNIVIAILRFGGAALVIVAFGPAPLNFFVYQLAVSTVELAVLMLMTRRVLPPVSAGQRRLLRRAEVIDLLGFSGAIAFAVVAWVLVTQVDKLVLSRILLLAQYGIFSLAAVAAGGILALGAPVAQALLPRLTKLTAEHADDEVIRIYRQGTQIVCLLAVPSSLALAFFSGPAIWAWTGDPSAAAAGPILTPYALGNGVMTLGAFPYYLQYARGDLRLHVIGSALLIATLVPAIAFAASRYGAVGAGYAWLCLHGLYFLVWVPIVHRRLSPGLHLRWLLRDILPIAAAGTGAAWAISALVAWPADRVATAALLAGASAAIALAGLGASSVARTWAWKVLNPAFARTRSAPR
jgi:O-antigen/teichoic acid export membrane protein